MEIGSQSQNRYLMIRKGHIIAKVYSVVSRCNSAEYYLRTYSGVFRPEEIINGARQAFPGKLLRIRVCGVLVCEVFKEATLIKVEFTQWAGLRKRKEG